MPPRRSRAGASTSPRSQGALARNSSCGGAASEVPPGASGAARIGWAGRGCSRRASRRASRAPCSSLTGSGSMSPCGCTGSARGPGRARSRRAADATARQRRPLTAPRRVVGEHPPVPAHQLGRPEVVRRPGGRRYSTGPTCRQWRRSSERRIGKAAASRPRSRSRTSRRRRAGATGRDGRRGSPGSRRRRARPPRRSRPRGARPRYEARLQPSPRRPIRPC